MNNSSLVAPVDAWQHLPVYVVYIGIGSVIGVGNLLIVLTIARYEALRSNKEYMIMLGLAVADCITSAAHLLAGIYRLHKVIIGTHHLVKNAWECMTTLHCITLTIGVTLSPMMLCLVSIDRLLCVTSPLSYVGWTATYARSFISSVYAFNAIGVAYAYVTIYGTDLMVAMPCVPPNIFRSLTHPVWAWYWSNSPQLYAVSSVVIYVFVAILYRRMNSTFLSDHPNQQYELKRQRKVTITLLFSAVCTFLFYVIPMSLGMFAMKEGNYSMAIWFWSLSNFNALMNVFIYPLRHKEMRQGLKAMMACKPMPTDVKMWVTVSVPPKREEHKISSKVVPITNANKEHVSEL